MKNSKAYILLNVLFAFLSGSITTSVALTMYAKYKKQKKQPPFLYAGLIDYSIETWIDDYKGDTAEIIKPPKSLAIWESAQPLDLSDKAAAKIGVAVLASKYGRIFINEQKPFEVTLINKKVWKVKGKTKSKRHASSEIFIQKADAQILRIIRNSNKQ